MARVCLMRRPRAQCNSAAMGSPREENYVTVILLRPKARFDDITEVSATASTASPSRIRHLLRHFGLPATGSRAIVGGDEEISTNAGKPRSSTAGGKPG